MKKLLLSCAIVVSMIGSPLFAQEDFVYTFDFDGDYCDNKDGIYVEIGYEGMMWIEGSNKYSPGGSFAILDAQRINDHLIKYTAQDIMYKNHQIYVDTTGYIFEDDFYISGTQYRNEGNVDVFKVEPCRSLGGE